LNFLGYSSKNPEENVYLRVISDGSCDTEHWSNDVENSALYQINKLNFTIYSHRKQL